MGFGFSASICSRMVLYSVVVCRVAVGSRSFGFLECVCLVVIWLKRRAGRLLELTAPHTRQAVAGAFQSPHCCSCRLSAPLSLLFSNYLATPCSFYISSGRSERQTFPADLTSILACICNHDSPLPPPSRTSPTPGCPPELLYLPTHLRSQRPCAHCRGRSKRWLAKRENEYTRGDQDRIGSPAGSYWYRDH